MKDAAILRGTNDGYDIILNDGAGLDDIFEALRHLLDGLRTSTASTDPQKIAVDVLTGSRLWSAEDRSKIERVFSEYEHFSIHKIVSDVITKAESQAILKQESIHVVDQTIRNGQEVIIQGDVLFLGTIHEGGKLFVSGNIYIFGDTQGIIHAGYPNFEDKLIVGNIHNAQQVRIGEQFQILDDAADKNRISASSLIYVNDLHVLDYGQITDLKEINPKFYNRIGGTING